MKTVSDRLIDLDARITQSKAKLKDAEANPVWTPSVRQQIDAIRTSLAVMEEYRALLLSLRERGED